MVHWDLEMHLEGVIFQSVANFLAVGCRRGGRLLTAEGRKDSVWKHWSQETPQHTSLSVKLNEGE